MKYKIIQILKLVFNVLNNPRNAYIYYELFRITKIKRYKKFNTKILNKNITVLDSKSFLATYREIFQHEIYKFKTNAEIPLIIDCGANIGLSVIYFKQQYPNSKIIAFEPDEKIYNILNNNIQSFDFKNIQTIKRGISNKECEINFFQEGADGGRIAQKDDENNITKIKTTRLINYLQQPIDMLKIDIEGSEYEVLLDSQEYLKNVKNLFIEYHSFYKKEQKLDEVLNIIKKAGFRYYIGPSGTPLHNPLYKRVVELSMDIQLNIFAYRK
ncbi:hypothetical protein A2331_02695 [Candidatus Falkowbacteria bacterium RIFOXYB2_FULL_34_18]|uniref:Methyltransferase FkbM domain-containing protein n=1 Tax=Candidatus Falkowbacteria bacterium RIFOXYD2_FULL_34_120 TaxID=1798007 RepID=A0A1F5TS41_9BACT|nr:MAG: hypothetical protein A2331_02695 [Candidatus Falkowbacteria bacterium RIFOXYB2_FULL_34_18]OGF29649.1 MAG: hypothetical protein A2500_00725 [Candidatus Falkowbacteria bacterium RIFOXYC12_FULL_34_55]OGF37376.1 MAG: hypothetical protein A2466_01495 [Candidatus Falkowbacteria bacterium RIFOXYC2_FULL_34_220]OGF39114.1 MAG: hypothetical protein A2515_00145 [Candidatus Falkowbacteria bacterium RIFOXYD12_FULL_34_57]OGF41638.1 MAG: hypothetical protein A2531_06380 [Candidatus Falkowbacteria bact